MRRYRVLNGINVDGERHEPGTTVELTPGQADAVRESVEKVTEPRNPKKVTGGSDSSRR